MGGPEPAARWAVRRIRAYSRHGFREEALEAFTEWREGEGAAGGPPDPFVANAALHAHREDPRAGRALFDLLCGEGFAPDAVTYNTLMTAHSRARQPDQVDALYEDMRWAGVAPDFRTFAIMGAAHARVGDLTRALMVGEQMRAMGDWDQSEYWLTVLGALAARRDTENALTLWFKLRRAAAFGGSPVRRDLCNAMLRCFVASRQGDKALELLAEMRAAAAARPGGAESSPQRLVESPCETSYTLGIAACCYPGERGVTASDVAHADALFTEFRALHCPTGSAARPRNSTYLALLGVCAAAGQPTRAREIVREMGPRGCRWDCAGLLLQAQAAAGDLAGALESFESMRSGGRAQRPDPRTCRVLLARLREAGQLSEAVGVLKYMQGRRIPVSEAQLTALTRECADLALAEGEAGEFSVKIAVQLQQALWRSPPEGAISQADGAFLQLKDKSVAEARVDLLKELGSLKSRGSSAVGESGGVPRLVVSVVGSNAEEVQEGLRRLLENQLSIKPAEGTDEVEGERTLSVEGAELESWMTRGPASYGSSGDVVRTRRSASGSDLREGGNTLEKYSK